MEHGGLLLSRFNFLKVFYTKEIAAYSVLADTTANIKRRENLQTFPSFGSSSTNL